MNLLGKLEEPVLVGLWHLSHELEVEGTVASLLVGLGHLTKGGVGIKLGGLCHAIFFELSRVVLCFKRIRTLVENVIGNIDVDLWALEVNVGPLPWRCLL
jgi:hypothetical protein